MNFYVSDLHFGHYNILKMSKRPFSSVEEMDNAFIQNWNSCVTNEDDVYIVGDFSYKSANSPEYYLSKLNGKKHLVIGNHDGHILRNKSLHKYFVEIKDILTVKDNGKDIIIFHYPMVEWNGFFRNSIHFYGHIHNNTQNDTYKIMSKIKNAYNVGIDILGYYPRTFDEVIELNKKFNEEHTIN